MKRWLDQSAVAALYRTGDQGPELLFIQRAQRKGDPWSGDMAFPGGRWQPEDANLKHTAVRETWEETGLDLHHHGRFVQAINPQFTRSHRSGRPMLVKPYLFHWHGNTPLHLNHEADDALWIPLSVLNDPAQRSTLIWKLGALPLKAPCYRYQGKTLWGLTLRMVDNIRRLELR